MPDKAGKRDKKPWRVTCTFGKKPRRRPGCAWRELSDVTVEFSMDRWMTLKASDAIALGLDLIREGRNAKCLERCALPDQK
jgi:hypothetical protein